MEKVAVIGQGYVGLPLAMGAVDAGFDVVGIDVDTKRVKQLSNGESFVEDIPSERLVEAITTGRYSASTDWQDAAGYDICVITVPTPLVEGAPDLEYVMEAGRSAAKLLHPGATVILESTTYPGTTDQVLRPLLENASDLTAGVDFHLGYSPERIDPGNRVWTLGTTPKLVSGIDAPSLERVKGFYDKIVGQTVPVSSTRTAELAKLLENTFRHVNIALVNEIAMVARDLETDIWEAVSAAATKPFGYMPFTPGPGVGGHCLPIDPSYLSWQAKRKARQEIRMISVANDVNEHMPDYVVRRITSGLNRNSLATKGSRILILGLAYKKNTGDSRESPALAIATSLVGMGANVRAVDPYIDPLKAPDSVECVALTESEVAHADAVVIATDHDEFDFDLVARSGKYIFDTRHRCSGPQVDHL
ncbi:MULTISPECIES: nucleotide sugar dehydrogenase [unclassified Streptomyces]|uniref:nucleotide sugar dehydrogenase n=1 Tax=unclassified Streptomyces TaxID=2593676 RepID=UPI00278C44E7|nr:MULTISPECIES: nucleotide sugar dehydrogenase [unclassified Streptomyces]